MSGRVFHAPFLAAHAAFELAGCWERSKNLVREHYPSARRYDTFEDVLADPSVDLVVVNTPTATHFEYARQALESGKHVVVEKAFTSTPEEAAELRRLARDRRRKLAVFQNRRWDSDFLSVRDIVEQGVLGNIVEANIAFARYNPTLSSKDHKEQPGPGSGIVKDLGPHVIDQALVLFGMPDTVFADIGITRKGSQVDDYFDILLGYDDTRVHVKGGYFYRHPTPEYAVFGTQGCFLKSRADVQYAQLDAGVIPDDPAYGLEPESAAGLLFTDATDRGGDRRIVAPRGNYMAFYDAMYRAIANDEPEPVSATDGLRVMQIIEAAFESGRTGKLLRP